MPSSQVISLKIDDTSTPKIGEVWRSKNEELYVLCTGINKQKQCFSGVILSGNSYWKIGEITETWNIHSFIKVSECTIKFC